MSQKILTTSAKKPEVKKKETQSTFILEELDRISHLALYYGFTPIKTPEITKNDQNKAKSCKDFKQAPGFDLHFNIEEKFSLLRIFFEEKMSSLPIPVMLCYEKPLVGHDKKESLEQRIGLEIIGSLRSVADAILIKTALSILEEEGYSNLIVDINSVGDKESAARFERELTAHFKKNASDLSLGLRQQFKNNMMELLQCGNDRCPTLQENFPTPISFLSEPSKQHFKEVLEYLETLEIPYRINHRLAAGKNYCCQTVFEIRTSSDENGCSQLLAAGTRYNRITKKAGLKRELPAIGLTLSFQKKNLQTHKPIKVSSIPQPKFYFIQLGFEAKLKSLKVIEELRKAKAPLYHSLTKDKMIGQLASAENMKIPYIIIMGQKEAMENSVVVRDSTTRSQETVKIIDLATYIKGLK